MNDDHPKFRPRFGPENVGADTPDYAPEKKISNRSVSGRTLAAVYARTDEPRPGDLSIGAVVWTFLDIAHDTSVSCKNPARETSATLSVRNEHVPDSVGGQAVFRSDGRLSENIRLEPVRCRVLSVEQEFGTPCYYGRIPSGSAWPPDDGSENGDTLPTPDHHETDEWDAPGQSPDREATTRRNEVFGDSDIRGSKNDLL